MPVLKIETNKKLSKEEKLNLMRDASELLSKLLDKPEAHIMVSFEHKDMIFNREEKDFFHITVMSIGFKDGSIDKIAKDLSVLVTELTEVENDAIYIGFEDLKRDMFAYMGKTFK